MKNLLLQVINRALFRTDSTLDFSRTLQAIELLADQCQELEYEDWPEIETEIHAADVIMGAYWVMSHWHGGQWSDEYRLLCKCGRIFKPGCTDGPEPDTSEEMVYDALDQMFQDANPS